jgi:hypothetical protein
MKNLAQKEVERRTLAHDQRDMALDKEILSALHKEILSALHKEILSALHKVHSKAIPNLFF